MKEDLLIRTAKRKQFSNKLNEEIVQVEKKLVRTKVSFLFSNQSHNFFK